MKMRAGSKDEHGSLAKGRINRLKRKNGEKQATDSFRKALFQDSARSPYLKQQDLFFSSTEQRQGCSG